MRAARIALLIGSLATATVAFAQDSVDLPPTVIRTGPDSRAADPETITAYEAQQQEALEKYGAFGLVTLGMKKPEIVVLCETVAEGFAMFAAEDTDRDSRQAKFGEVWRFEQRLAEPLEQARKTLGESGYQRAKRRSNQAMGLLSMISEPHMEAEVRAAPDDLMYLWVKGLAFRCGQRLDEWGVATASGNPPPEYIEAKSGFRYRGADYVTTFADTGLGAFAKSMCREGAAPDFNGAPLDQRGKEGMSLLDWAIECDDRASFDALITAGFDLEAKGLWEDPPLVRVASEKRIWYLRRLLDEGVKADSMGRRGTALMTANRDLDAINFGGDTRAAFNLLRERGASLNFPNFRESMWQQWSLHETRWDLILEHWDEFESDPVELADDLEYYLSGDMNWAKMEFEDAAREVKKLLISEHGACFPVGNAHQMKTDERGFRIQPNCPTGG